MTEDEGRRTEAFASVVGHPSSVGVFDEYSSSKRY